MRKVIRPILLIVGLFGAWVLAVVLWAESLKPAGPTLADHLAHRPLATRQYSQKFDEREYLILIGPMGDLWLVLARGPSGPPVYIFDSKGNLADWTPDHGNDKDFHRRWPGWWEKRRPLTPEEVRAWPGATR